MYTALFSQMKKQLGQLERWFDLTAEFAEQKKFDPEILLGARLAPDQFPLSRQVQIACDTLKLGASRLTGKEAPSHPDTEKTFAELRERIQSTRAYLDSFSEADFADSATRSISQPRWQGKTMAGADYFLEHVLPNLYFHLNHVYAILRHNGVPLGKRDYLGQLSMREPS